MRRAARGLSRRDAAKLAAAGLLSIALMGHTPYAQWTIYRKRNLFIVAARTDERATLQAQAIAERFAAELPESRARFTRAADAVRVASLLKSGQLDVAVVSRDEAESMLAGSGSFVSVGPVPLRLLAELADHLLVTVPGFKDRHAFLLARAFDRTSPYPALPRPAAAPVPPLPYHPGALAYRAGSPLPPEAGEPEPAHPHPH